MKFKDVPARSEINILHEDGGKTKGWVMFGKFCLGGVTMNIDKDTEVELISKCDNCKNFQVHGLECPFDGGESQYHVCTETFSCSKFKERVNQ